MQTSVHAALLSRIRTERTPMMASNQELSLAHLGVPLPSLGIHQSEPLITTVVPCG